MRPWILTCPQCDTPNEVPVKLIKVECGVVSCTCTCLSCNHKFGLEQEYWRWLQLDEEPPAEPQITAN